MKRGVFDILRRGFDNTLANWQISLIRFLEAVVFLVIMIGAIIVMLTPIVVSLGISASDLKAPDEIADALAMAVVQKWMLLIWVFLGVCVLLLLFMLIHSFVEAGCVRVLVDGDRIAGPELTGPRSRYRAFSLDRFMTGAKDGWWTVFWIYNIVWGLGCLLLMIPLLPTIVLMLIFRQETGIALMTGCLGLVATMFFAIVVTVVAAIWCNRALVNWGARRESANDASASASREVRADLGRHLGAAIAIFVVAMAGSAFFATFSMFAGFGEMFGRGQNVLIAVMMPLRLMGSILNSAFSAALGSWFIATYAALALEPRVVQASGLPSNPQRQAGGLHYTGG